ncbi:MAG: TolC family protein, partial [Myxococcota bacterium]
MWLLVSAALALTPDEAVRAALANDPALAEAEARLEAARGERAASRWLRNNPEVSGKIGEARLELQASQAISLTGEGLAAGRAARAEVDGAEATLARARLVAAADVRRAYVRAVVAEADLVVSASERETASRVRAAAETRLSAGDAPELEARLARRGAGDGGLAARARRRGPGARGAGRARGRTRRRPRRRPARRGAAGGRGGGARGRARG